MTKRHNIITLDCRLLHQTEAAYYVEIDTRRAWVPKSLCEVEIGGGKGAGMSELQIPEWLAVEKEFI